MVIITYAVGELSHGLHVRGDRRQPLGAVVQFKQTVTS
jgi:hypothetical protein